MQQHTRPPTRVLRAPEGYVSDMPISSLQQHTGPAMHGGPAIAIGAAEPCLASQPGSGSRFMTTSNQSLGASSHGPRPLACMSHLYAQQDGCLSAPSVVASGTRGPSFGFHSRSLHNPEMDAACMPLVTCSRANPSVSVSTASRFWGGAGTGHASSVGISSSSCGVDGQRAVACGGSLAVLLDGGFVGRSQALLAVVSSRVAPKRFRCMQSLLLAFL